MTELCMVQKIDRKISGYWDGGGKDTFEWCIEKHHGGHDKKGTFVRVGSWDANHFFNVQLGKTDKQTLANARRKLQAGCARERVKCTFEYIEKEDF